MRSGSLQPSGPGIDRESERFESFDSQKRLGPARTDEHRIAGLAPLETYQNGPEMHRPRAPVSHPDTELAWRSHDPKLVCKIRRKHGVGRARVHEHADLLLSLPGQLGLDHHVTHWTRG